MRTLFVRLSSMLLLTASGMLAACGPPCNQARRCAVDGEAGQPLEICNGDDFVTCEDGNRGAVVFCENQSRKVVCGPGGWSFEYAPLPSE